MFYQKRAYVFQETCLRFTKKERSFYKKRTFLLPERNVPFHETCIRYIKIIVVRKIPDN